MNKMLRAEKLAAKEPKTLRNSFAFIPSIGDERTKFKQLSAAKKAAEKMQSNYIGKDIVVYKHSEGFILGWDMPDAVDYKEKFVCHG